jgi:hypothetical protein
MLCDFDDRVGNTVALGDGCAVLSVDAGPPGWSRVSSYFPAKITREHLASRLLSPRFQHLSSILSSQRPSVGHSLSSAITGASLRLASAVSSDTSASQILGAVTTLEIVLTNRSDAFDTVEKRIRQLLTPDACNFFEVDRVLKQRHNYVHSGEEPAGNELPAKAIGLALTCLLQVARLACCFPNKETVLRYLDLSHNGHLMMQMKCWTSEETAHFQSLLRLRRADLELPYFVVQRRGLPALRA